MDALYLGSFKRSVNNNTSFFPYGALKHLRNETQETNGWRWKWHLMAKYGFIPAAKTAELANDLCPPHSGNYGAEHPSIPTFPDHCLALVWQRGKSADLWCFAGLQILNRWILPHQGTCTIYCGIRVIHQSDNSFLMQTHYSDGSSSVWNREAGQKKISSNNGEKKKESLA